MIRKSSAEIHWLEFELLAPFAHKLKHAVFLRHGGFSQGPYAGMNLSMTLGDDPLHVEANLAEAKAILSIDQLAASLQEHKDGIAAIDERNYSHLKSCDALMTAHANIGLKISHADCQAAIFYDPINHALATVHCGWRGHVCEIYQKTVQAMASTYGSKPADLHVAIGPSLGPAHAQFVNYQIEFPESFWQFRTLNDHFDLWAVASWQLKQANIIDSHIQILKMCTYANSADCFSYRRNKRITGAHGTFAALL